MRCQANNRCRQWRHLRVWLRGAIAALALLSIFGLLITPQFVWAAKASTSPPSGAGNMTLPSGLNEEQVRDYLARLPDERVRELLIAELSRKAANKTALAQNEDMFQRLEVYLHNLRKRLGVVFASPEQVFQVPALLWSQVSAGGTIGSGQLFGSFVLAFVAAWVVKRLYRWATGLAGRLPGEMSARNLGAQFGVLALRGVTELIGIVIFALTALGALLLAGTTLTPASPLFVSLLWAVVGFQLVSLGSRLLLAPRAPSLRLVPLSDVAARAVHVRIMVVATVLILIRITTVVMREYGLEDSAADLVALSEVLLLITVLVGMIWQVRKPVAAIIGGGTGSTTDSLLERLADHWHVLATVYVVALLVWAVAYAYSTGTAVFGAAVGSLVLVALIPVADMGLQRLVTRLFGPDDWEATESARATTAPIDLDSTSRDEDLVERPFATVPKQSDGSVYERVALRNLRILLAALVLLVFFRLWGLDPRTLVNALVGEKVGGSLLDTALVLLIAYAIWSFTKTAVERYVRSHEPDLAAVQDSDGGGPGATRLETLLPLIRKFMLMTLAVIVVMVFLSSLGVNIGPLIAGAGIVGIAIGFGAQTLVRDIVSGVFFLLDDAFRMGEYVEIGNTRGRVEKISVRSLQLRHHNGPVHTIPFGQISRLTNYSRDYVIKKFELRVPFETDIDKVRKLIKNVGKDMMQDPELAPLMLGPLKSQGVTHMDDSALIMRCKFTAIPGQQFMVRRAAFTRIQKAFAENGIHFAPRRVIVEAATPMTPEQAAKAAAAVLGSETTNNNKGDRS
jgi:small-conductance mechanosensitive channel